MMSCPLSITTSLGFDVTGNSLFGYAIGLSLTSSDIQVPAVGVGLSASGAVHNATISTSKFQILAEGIPSSLGNVYVHMKNVTQNQTIGAATLSSSTPYVDFGVGFSSAINSGDQIALLIHSDNPGTLPSIMWRLA